ncbi:MAG: hypothetical protein FWC93_05055 [Defluviitaleaceae bacterium]|nr:hypothetical protein [Defluviitaleaceae bacterium]
MYENEQMAPMEPITSEGGSVTFIQQLHKHGSSPLFLTGIILFTVGSVMSTILSANLFAIFPLAFLALPVVALFLIYAASKSPKLPEKTLPALTLVKVHAIIGLVLVCIIAAIFVIVALILTVTAAIEPWVAGAMVITVIIMLFVLAILTVYFIFYFVSLFRILKDMREGILHNNITNVRGVTAFTVVNIISIALGVLGSLIGLLMLGATNVIMDELYWALGPDFHFVETMLEGIMASMAVSMMFSLATMAGIVLLLISLNKFNSSLAHR